jgi:hypothetical protein
MYVLEHYDGEYFVITHENCNFAIGHVYKDGNRYRVTRSEVGDDIDIATVNPPEQAIPVFAAHYERHPPEWVATNEGGWAIEGPAASRAPCYTKSTAFGGLDVKRDQHGKWLAYRGVGCPLLMDGMPATFATRQEAQHIADLHGDEGYGNSVPIDDGYSWQADPNVDEWLAERGRTRTSDSTAAAA